jgi:hypothetical protein
MPSGMVDLKSRFLACGYSSERMNVLNAGGGGDAPVGLPPQLREIEFKQLDHLDAYGPPLEKAKGCPWRAETINFILQDIREFDCAGYDLVLFFDVVEHLPKADALEVLRKLKHAFIFIPLETGELMDGEGIPFQRHLSRWTEQEFIDLGFRTEVFKDFHNVRYRFDAMWAEK